MHCEWDERRSRDNLSNDLSNQQKDERVDPQVQQGVVILSFLIGVFVAILFQCATSNHKCLHKARSPYLYKYRWTTFTDCY